MELFDKCRVLLERLDKAQERAQRKKNARSKAKSGMKRDRTLTSKEKKEVVESLREVYESKRCNQKNYVSFPGSQPRIVNV